MTMTSQNENRLRSYIKGACYDNNVKDITTLHYRIKTNRTLKDLYRELDIVQIIKVRKRRS